MSRPMGYRSRRAIIRKFRGDPAKTPPKDADRKRRAKNKRQRIARRDARRRKK